MWWIDVAKQRSNIPLPFTLNKKNNNQSIATFEKKNLTQDKYQASIQAWAPDIQYRNN